jgi:hypothetical protein
LVEFVDHREIFPEPLKTEVGHNTPVNPIPSSDHREFARVGSVPHIDIFSVSAGIFSIARKLKVEYAGAIYHVKSRGGGRGDRLG